jgi:hypothetical protein
VNALPTYVDLLTSRWTEHFASDGHDPLPADLHNAQNEAEREAVKPWPEMIAGKRRRVMQLRAERDRFVVEHLGDLAASREHDAYAALDALIAAFAALEVAERGYADVEQWYTVSSGPCPVSTVGTYRASTSLPSSLRCSVSVSAASRHRYRGPSTAPRTPTRRSARRHEIGALWNVPRAPSRRRSSRARLAAPVTAVCGPRCSEFPQTPPLTQRLAVGSNCAPRERAGDKRQ